ncbi:extensin-like [Cervus canadensis]|uniref:extensin-like n=1 Tax=Cervus canadensis TaxID=1574408 RepID=UPI001C9E5969|nr:extensin-like [Cervus canadensis]
MRGYSPGLRAALRGADARGRASRSAPPPEPSGPAPEPSGPAPTPIRPLLSRPHAYSAPPPRPSGPCVPPAPAPLRPLRPSGPAPPRPAAAPHPSQVQTPHSREARPRSAAPTPGAPSPERTVRPPSLVAFPPEDTVRTNLTLRPFTCYTDPAPPPHVYRPPTSSKQHLPPAVCPTSTIPTPAT